MPVNKLDAEKSITVLGNGIIGLACAYHLQKRGYDVRVIDRAPVDSGTSIGNAGGIAAASIYPVAEPGLWKRMPGMLLDPLGPVHLRFSHLPALIPFLYRFIQASRPENYTRGIAALGAIMQQVMDDHHSLLDDIELRHTLTGEGVLYVYKSEAARDAALPHWHAKEAYGVEWFKLDRDGLRQHEPCLGGEATAGIYSPTWAHYRDPLEMLVGLADFLRAQGVEFVQAEIADLAPRADGYISLLSTDGRTFDAPRLVVAGGAWSGEISMKFGEPFPVEADRGYNTTLPTPGIEMRKYVTFAEDSFVAVPMSMGLRIGGAAEFGGLAIPPNYQRSEMLLKLAARYLPDLKTDGGTQWMGHRPETPDSIPVISRSSKADNVYYAFGHGHLGLTMSVTTGRLIADLVEDADPGIDMTPYRIDRYQ